ncbi:MAG: CoA transferase [Dehalococcoidales bacterium]|nr:CoA transferase [Dehalococcoidales bacterium]
MYEKPGIATLAGYSVLDLTDEKGSLCVKLLSGMGADVIRLNLEKKRERNRLRSLIKKADFLIETFQPGYLASLGMGYKDLAKINPRLVMVSITHFGQSGPYRDLKSSDLINQALGGWLSVTGEATKPLKLCGEQSYNTASLFAVNGILLALRQTHNTGKGQHIDISIMECVAATLDHVLPRYFYGGVVAERQGSCHWNNAFDILPCRDGYIMVSLHQHWDTLVEWLASEGMAEDLTDARWKDREERNRHIDHILQVLGKWTSTHRVDELVEKGQLMRFPWAGVK